MRAVSDPSFLILFRSGNLYQECALCPAAWASRSRRALPWRLYPGQHTLGAPFPCAHTGKTPRGVKRGGGQVGTYILGGETINRQINRHFFFTGVTKGMQRGLWKRRVGRPPRRGLQRAARGRRRKSPGETACNTERAPSRVQNPGCDSRLRWLSHLGMGSWFPQVTRPWGFCPHWLIRPSRAVNVTSVCKVSRRQASKP